MPDLSLTVNRKDNLKSWKIVAGDWGKQNREIKDDENIIRVRYPKGSSSPGIQDAPLGGTGFYAQPDIFPADDVTLTYEVRFAENFQPNKGGKLPGLYISPEKDTKFQGASGGRRVKVNASCRVMWRQNFAAEAYVYTPSGVRQDPAFATQSDVVLNSDFGDSLGRRTLKLSRNAWNRISVRVVMNTPGKADGIIEVTINDQTYSFRKVVWRKSNDVKITALFFSTFFGGKSDYATPVSTFAQFRNFRLTNDSTSSKSCKNLTA